MGKISKPEIGTFLRLFIRSGYVLNFTTNDFDVFTMDSIGVALCDKYKVSKGKSLTAYTNEASEENILKLIKDLFEYYEDTYEYEYNKDYEEDLYWGSSRYDEGFDRVYQKCKTIFNRMYNREMPLATTVEELKEKFSSEYLSKQIELMVKMQSENPTEAIGKAKELIESCCKTVLDGMGIAWDKNWDVGKLTGETLSVLNLLPANVNSTDQGADSIKAVLGNLRAIPTKLAELRNPYGSGHGKSASFTGLEVRHSKLAVGSSITFVDFVWSTYEAQK
ncbi:MAG: abortive infection family protein [Mobilitalea sp.]